MMQQTKDKQWYVKGHVTVSKFIELALLNDAAAAVLLTEEQQLNGRLRHTHFRFGREVKKGTGTICVTICNATNHD